MLFGTECRRWYYTVLNLPRALGLFLWEDAAAGCDRYAMVPREHHQKKLTKDQQIHWLYIVLRIYPLKPSIQLIGCNASRRRLMSDLRTGR